MICTDGFGRTNSVASNSYDSVTSKAVATLLNDRKLLNSWSVFCLPGTKTYIHPDVATAGDRPKWIKVVLSFHTSYADSTGISEYLLKLNYTPYEGTNYRGLVSKLIAGLYTQEEMDVMLTFNGSFGWDENGIFILNNDAYITYNTTVFTLYSK